MIIYTSLYPLDAPVVKRPKKKPSSKKHKEAKNVGFDNPVYSLKEGAEEGTGSMESVPLDEDDLPAYVEHDGTGTALRVSHRHDKQPSL